jgi:hypothetical protein
MNGSASRAAFGPSNGLAPTVVTRRTGSDRDGSYRAAMTYVQDHLIDLSDFAMQRLRNRVEGLTDDEYFWRPVANSIADAKAEWPESEVPPFTTISWRLHHIIVDVLLAERTATWLGLRPEPGDVPAVEPENAATAVKALDHAAKVWRSRLSSVDDRSLALQMGEIAGYYADGTRFSFALHILDELIHHGAEVGVVRDLYRHQKE